MAARESGALLGVFEAPEQAAEAVEQLRAAGFGGDAVEVLSASPYPEGAFGEEPPKHRLYLFALAGALAGFGVGLLVTIGTQLSYPLVTGGKPILSIPPMINVLFEGTMLGAIVLTVAGVLFESRLPSWRGAPYDPRISEGCLGVLVAEGAGPRLAAERALRRAGAVDVLASPE